MDVLNGARRAAACNLGDLELTVAVQAEHAILLVYDVADSLTPRRNPYEEDLHRNFAVILVVTTGVIVAPTNPAARSGNMGHSLRTCGRPGFLDHILVRNPHRGQRSNRIDYIFDHARSCVFKGETPQSTWCRPAVRPTDYSRLSV